MSRIRTALAVFAASAALVAAPVTATATTLSAGGGSAPAEARAGCSVLSDYGSGWATIYNQCGNGINATVSLDWSWDPDCIYISGYSYGTVYWDHDTLPDYAYDC